MDTTHFRQLKVSRTLHYALMASVGMHLCAFSMIFFWNPEMQTVARKNPIVKIQVALLETPQKTPAPSVAKNPVETKASRTPAIRKPLALSRPAVPPLVPVQAKHSPPKQIRNVFTEPSFDIKHIPETVSAVSSQLIPSENFSKSISRVSPLKMTMTIPSTSQPISFPTWLEENFGSLPRTVLQPVKPSPMKTLLSDSGSSIKTYVVAAPAKFNSKNLKPVSIQISNSLTRAGTGPVSSARAPSKTTYRSPTMTPLKMVSISDLTPKPESIQEGEGNNKELRRGYTRQIRHRIAQKKFYPAVARRRGFEGQPVVAFILNKDGSLGHLALDKTSGHKMLDQAALKAVKKGAPFPEIPEQLNLKKFKFKLPISFSLE